jgi:hypothetical protein
MSIDHRRFSSVAAVACIAIGLAAVTAVLTLIQATVLRPLPFPEPDRLVRVWAAQRDGDQRMDLSIPEIGEIAQHARSFDAFAGTARMRIVARLPAGAERLRGEAVTARYFELIGQTAAHGRVFAPDEFATSAAPVALISHGVWQQRFGGAADIVGRSLATSDAEYRIVGVMPPGFDGTIEADEVEFWVPLAQYRPTALATSRDVRQTWTIARLRDGVGGAAAGAGIAGRAGSGGAPMTQA